MRHEPLKDRARSLTPRQQRVLKTTPWTSEAEREAYLRKVEKQNERFS